MKIKLNPNAKEFLHDNDPTLVGLYWAMYWRFFCFVFLVVIAIALVANLLN